MVVRSGNRVAPRHYGIQAGADGIDVLMPEAGRIRPQDRQRQEADRMKAARSFVSAACAEGRMYIMCPAS